MPRILFAFFGLVLLLLVASPSAFTDGEAKSPARERLDSLRAAARAAHTSGDAAAYLARSRDIREFLHGSPNSVLQVMSAQAFGHDQPGALDSFAQFIAMGQSDAKLLDNDVFQSLRETARGKALEAEMRNNDLPVSRSTVAFQMPEAGLVPEDVDYDPVTRRFFVSSVLKREILVFDPRGHASVFARAPDARLMMALKVDAQRRRLWATGVGLNGFASVPREAWKTSLILVYDLDSGRLLNRIEGPPGATLGDIALTPAGDVVASDNDGAIYLISAKSQALERLDSGEFISPQTPAILPGGRIAYVPDYLRGIAMLDLETKRVTWMESDGRHALNGIDGLYLSGRTLLATQNGASPERVVRFQLDRSLTRIESESVVERATPTLGDPTHGVIVAGSFYYIANSGWDALQDDGAVKPGRTLPTSSLMRAPLTGK